MKEYIKFETKLFLKNRRNKFLFLGVAAFLLGLIFYIPYQNVGDINEKIEIEASSVQNAIASVPLHEIEEETYMEDYYYYDYLILESRALASQNVALTMFDDLNQYVEEGVRLAQTRIQAHEEGYGSLPDELLTPLSQSLRDQEVYYYLQENNMQIETDAENGISILVLAINWFSAVSFFFLLFLCCDVLTEDKEHETIVSAYPVDANRKVIGKLMIHTLSVLAILTILFATGFFIWSLVFEPGNINYPVPIYWRGSFTAVPSYTFVIGILIIFFAFIINIVLMSSLLNMLSKNKYLTIFIGSFFYILSFLYSAQHSILRFTPLNYLNPVEVLNGEAASQYTQPTNDALMAIIVLSVWSLIYAIVLSLIFAKNNRVKAEKLGGKNTR